LFPLFVFFLLNVPGDPACLVFNQSFHYVYAVNGVPGCSLPQTGRVSIYTDIGKVAISASTLQYIFLSPDSLYRFYKNPVLQFVYNILSLTLSLSLIIGILNLIPLLIPGNSGLDGGVMLESIAGFPGRIFSYIVSLMFFLLIFLSLL
jgi:hypothetical protein